MSPCSSLEGSVSMIVYVIPLESLVDMECAKEIGVVPWLRIMVWLLRLQLPMKSDTCKYN